jgi:hypothetical protein
MNGTLPYHRYPGFNDLPRYGTVSPNVLTEHCRGTYRVRRHHPNNFAPSQSPLIAKPVWQLPVQYGFSTFSQSFTHQANTVTSQRWIKHTRDILIKAHKTKFYILRFDHTGRFLLYSTVWSRIMPPSSYASRYPNHPEITIASRTIKCQSEVRSKLVVTQFFCCFKEQCLKNCVNIPQPLEIGKSCLNSNFWKPSPIKKRITGNSSNHNRIKPNFISN